MRVMVDFQIDGRSIREEVDGKDATDILSIAKTRVMKQLGWKGMFLAAFTPLRFGQEAVRLYNAHSSVNLPIPQSAEEFIKVSQDTGRLIVVEP